MGWLTGVYVSVIFWLGRGHCLDSNVVVQCYNGWELWSSYSFPPVPFLCEVQRSCTYFLCMWHGKCELLWNDLSLSTTRLTTQTLIFKVMVSNESRKWCHIWISSFVWLFSLHISSLSRAVKKWCWHNCCKVSDLKTICMLVAMRKVNDGLTNISWDCFTKWITHVPFILYIFKQAIRDQILHQSKSI